jgi:hypothetical protein
MYPLSGPLFRKCTKGRSFIILPKFWEDRLSALEGVRHLTFRLIPFTILSLCCSIKSMSPLSINLALEGNPLRLRSFNSLTRVSTRLHFPGPLTFMSREGAGCGTGCLPLAFLVAGLRFLRDSLSLGLTELSKGLQARVDIANCCVATKIITL